MRLLALAMTAHAFSLDITRGTNDYAAEAIPGITRIA